MADLNPDTISKLRVVDLREHLSSRGLPTSGLKADLVKRLKEALLHEQAAETEYPVETSPQVTLDLPDSYDSESGMATLDNRMEDLVSEENERIITEQTVGDQDQYTAQFVQAEERHETEIMNVEDERLNLEEARLQAEEENIRLETERLHAKEEMLRLEAEKLHAEEEERLRLEAERMHAEEEERLRLEAERMRAEEEERLRLEAERMRAEEEERLRLEAERMRAEEEERLRLEAERMRAEEEEKLRLEAERMRAETEERMILEAEEIHAEEEKRLKLEAERMRAEEEERLKLEAEKLRAEEEERLQMEAERWRAIEEEKIRLKMEKLHAEEEKKKKEAEIQRMKKIEEMREAELESLRIEEEKRKSEKEKLFREKEEERRMAEEKQMKVEMEMWLVAEQMQRAQEEHKRRLKAEEEKQKMMEEEIERQNSEQQQDEESDMFEDESQNYNVLPDMIDSSQHTDVPGTVNILPPPPTVLMSSLPPPPPPPVVPSNASVAPQTSQASAFLPPPPSFTSHLETDINSNLSVGINDIDISESMDTSENTSDIRLPQALEKVLALKDERAQQLGVDPDVVVQPAPATVEKSIGPVKSNVLTLVSIDEDEVTEQTDKSKKDAKSKRRKKKKKKHHNRVEQKNELNKQSENQKSKETSVDIDIEYVQEVIDIADPMYSQFMKIFEKFKLTDAEKEKEEAQANAEKEANKEVLNPMAFRKKPVDLGDDDEDQDENKKEDKPKLSKRKLKKLSRMTVAELKQKVNRPELVEMHDVTAKDPVLLLHLKASRNTVPVPRHWCFKRKYLQGKRGIEKPAFELPDFIKKTGIMEMRQALQEKEDQKTMKAKMRERVRPKLGKIDIDYQKLHDAFFKWQTKPRMTIHGDLYYEGKEFETRLKEKKPGDLSEDLRTALGMPTGPNANKCPPPWLIAMQRYGPPPSYPNLKIPGLNAPIPEGCLFGYHAGGWGKPPVDETGRPLYGDVFGTQTLDNQPHIQEEEIDHTLWGELESESSEEEEEEEEEDEEEEEEKQEDETGLVTPAEGLITPSGFSSIPAGMETPDMIELRKRKIEAEKEGGETPALYTILPEKKNERVGAAMMGSTHIYDLAGAIPASKLKSAGTTSVPPHGIEVALDPSELEMDSAAMAARYEQTMREQQSQLEKEDLSDMVAEHAARQKNKRKKQQLDSAKPPKKYKEFKF